MTDQAATPTDDWRVSIHDLADGPFVAAWKSLTNAERSEVGTRGFDRYRKLTPYVDATVGRLKAEQGRKGLDRAILDNGNGADHDYDPGPPPPQHDAPSAEWMRLYGEIGEDSGQRPPLRNMVDWHELAQSDPPKFEWIWDHWLSWHPTGLWGRGGIGKSLLAQQIETACAIGRPLWGTSCAPIHVLAWHCEDDRDEIWRRQDRICKRLGINFTMLNNLHIDARCGMENALFTTVYGRPAWTPLYEELREQVNDYDAQVLVLDNISQIFGGNVNDQHHVTTFVNGIIGLGRGKQFCPILLGHVAKAQGSEWAGNMAWENAVRMRWYLAEKLPDEAGADLTESGTEGTGTRFLCKRKANYTQNDYVQFEFDDGVFAVRNQEDLSRGGTMDGLRAMRAKTVVLQAVERMAGMGIYGSDVKSANYLPSKILELKLADGLTKLEIRAAMNALLMDGALIRGQVGKYAKGAPKFGLTVPPKT